MTSPIAKQCVWFAACVTIMGLVNAGIHDTPAASWASTYSFVGVCDNQICGYIDSAELVYTGSTTPTKPTTWGRIKSLYRM